MVWTQEVGTSSTGNDLEKTSGTTGWNAGAVSTKGIASGDGYAEFTVADDNVYWMAGLSNGNPGVSYQEIDSSTIESRALAGVASGTIVFVLPGSPGACRLAMDKIIIRQLDVRTRPCNLVALLPRIRHEEYSGDSGN